VLQDGLLFRANRIVCSRCDKYYKFESPNYPPLATAFNFDIKVDWQLTRRPPNPSDSRELLVEEQVSRKVATIHLVPDANSSILDAVYNTPGLVEGIIIEGFGKGNLPGNSQLKELVPKCAQQGLLTFLISQCHRGNVGDSYSTSGSHLGAVMCGDLTMPATFVKASLILARSRDRSEVSEMIKANWRGEITEEPLLQRHKTGQVMRYWGTKLKRYFDDEEDVRTVVHEVVQSVLFSAARFNEVVSIGELLAARPNLKYARTKDCLNLLHAAVFNFESSTFNFLLAQFTPDELLTLANARDIFGYSPVLYALSLREIEALRILSPLAREVQFEDMPVKMRSELCR
jgi:Glutaminase/Asparaginase C-terminal domain